MQRAASPGMPFGPDPILEKIAEKGTIDDEGIKYTK